MDRSSWRIKRTLGAKVFELLNRVSQLCLHNASKRRDFSIRDKRATKGITVDCEGRNIDKEVKLKNWEMFIKREENNF